MRWPLRFGIYAGIAYLLICLWFYWNQRNLIYYPAPRTEGESLATAKSFGLLPWRDSGGAVRGWIKPARGAVTQRWLVFHGNAGSALERDEFAAGLQHAAPGREIVLVEYPGYDCRGGRPDEAAIEADADAAVAEFAARPEPLYLLGESLGGAVAVLAAARAPEKVRGLVLVTPLPDLAAVGAHHYPWLPVRLLLKDRFPAARAAAGLKAPAFFVLAGCDQTIPSALGERYFSGYPGAKAIWREPKADHNDIAGGPEAAWWPEAEKFFAAPAS